MSNCEESGLFWKKVPSKIYITKDESTVPGHKPMKNCLTICYSFEQMFLLEQIEPLLVQGSKNHRTFKNVRKKEILWRSNRKDGMTRNLFSQ